MLFDRILWQNVFIQKAFSIMNFSMLHIVFFKNKIIALFQFHTPGLRNHPSYPKQEEFLKYHEGNLKSRNNSNFGIFMS